MQKRKKIKVLFTGSKGFIGTRMKKVLDRQRDIDYVEYDLQDGNDIRDKFKLDKLFEKENFDLVLHMAALTGVRSSEDYPEEYISTNTLGTSNITQLCKKYGVKNMVFFSSSSVFGGCNFHTDNTPVGLGINNAYEPKSIYAITKVSGELLVEKDLDNYAIIRPFTVYGESARKDMVIYKWIEQLKKGQPISYYGDGESSRGYTYVEDICGGVMKAIKLLIDKGGKYKFNLGGQEIFTLKELYSIFLKVCEKKGIYVDVKKFDRNPADVEHSFADISVAKNDLGFNPEPKFERIITNILNKEL